MFNLNIEKLHHAYLIKGGENILPKFLDSLEKIGIKTSGNPDFFIKKSETFSVEDAKEIKSFQGQSAALGDLKIIIILTKYFSHPSQNSLLKAFEEPGEKVHFFVITEEVEILLPTLKSRLIFLGSDTGKVDVDLKKDAQKFLDSEKEDRMSFIDKIVKKFSKEETSIPLKNYFSQFLNQLEVEIKSRGLAGKYDLAVLWRVKDYIHDQGSSVKNLLETLALTF